MLSKEESRARRKLRVRRKLEGTTARPRLSVFRSAKHIYAQAVDDSLGGTLAAASTLAPSVKSTLVGAKTDDARAVGKALAEALLKKGIDSVVFDRNGYLYHGRIKALAEAAREAGLKF